MTVTALLGPTNTGKTHRAVERLLEHESGMIGLPLRLLAREVYDRITARVGEARVALVTGEEKRVPRRADYWVCTVEAMPVDHEVDFVAVDEIQLAAHDQRGHVFTDRMLHARGRKETMFLGAGTMAPLLATLVPAAVRVEHPRLSRLSFAGASPLSRLPPRSAVVGFSVTQVYEIAERLRARRGGAAVVLGALSPRTRNAQVALFQSGEVEYMVATDAIGMGLNLDVRHVAFAGLRKFDGKEVRELDPAELAQIAGRAGRYTEDGTFGGIAPLDVPASIVHAIETHKFPAVRRVLYRNSDLDTSSLDALVASLRKPAPAHHLRPVADAEDTAALLRLSALDDIRRRARGPEAVALLWDVCQVPDYRKLLFESHVAFLRELFEQLTGPSGRLDPDWVASGIGELDESSRVGGDVDTLVARIAAVRVWTYVSHRSAWLSDAETWQARARAVEDRLSDALHEALVQRFVDRGGRRRAPVAAPRPRRAGAAGKEAGDSPEAEAPRGHPFAALSKMRVPGVRAPAAAPSADADAWVERLVAASHAAFVVGADARVTFEERTFAELTAGPSLVLPDVRLRDVDDLGAGARARVLRRALAFARDLVGELLEPLRGPSEVSLSPAARGILYQLEAGLGTALAHDARVQLAELSAADAESLARRGVVVGTRVVFHSALLRREALVRRHLLILAREGPRAVPPLPQPGAVTFRRTPAVADASYVALGYPAFGPRAVRADVAERVAVAAADEAYDAAQIATWLGCPAGEARRIASALTRVSAP